MQNVKKNLSSALNFFKSFGMYYEAFDIPPTGFKRFFRFWPIGMYLFNAFLVSISLYHTADVMITTNLDLKTSYTTFIFMAILGSSASTGIIYTYYYQKKIDKMWTMIAQVDDFILRFLEIPIDYRRENMGHLLKPLFHFATNFIIAISLTFLDYEGVKDYHRYVKTGIYFALLNHLNSNKYIYFVSIINNRLKILAENYDNIRRHDYKILTLMRVHSILWRLIEKLERVFNWPVILATVAFYITLLFYAHIQALDLKKIWMQREYYASIAPIFNIAFYCYNCHRLQTNRKALLAATAKAHSDESLVGFEETLYLQLFHQNLICSPKELFVFSHELIMEAICFGFYYSLVFIQFYFFE